jgi:hypothetical protein
LRVAAEHCAEPNVRIALREVADEADAPSQVTEIAPIGLPPIARGRS